MVFFSMWQRLNPRDTRRLNLWWINVWTFSGDVVSNILWTNSAHREHDQILRKPRQPALSHPHDHSWPGERRQGLAPGEEPRTRGPKGGRPRQQDGLRDLPDTTSGYQGGPTICFSFIRKYPFNPWLLSGPVVILVTSLMVIVFEGNLLFKRKQFVLYITFLIWRSRGLTLTPQYSYLLSMSHCNGNDYSDVFIYSLR